MSDPQRAQVDKITAALKTLRLEVDSRLLLAALLGHASAMAEQLVAAKVKTKAEVYEMFAYAVSDALEPEKPADPPQVVYMNGEEPLGSKH